MRDVGERPAVHERRRVLEGLHQVGRERVAQQHGHRAVGLQVARGDRRLVAGVADHDVADAALEVGPRLGQAEDRHQLGRDDDVEAVLARVAVADPAQPDDQVAQRPVVEVHDPLPADAADVDAELVAVVDVVVDQRREQVVRGREGGEVAGEVQVDVVHRDDLGVAAAGRAALHPEHRSHRRLAQAGHRLVAEAVQRVGEPDGGRGLALAGGRGGERGHQDQPPRRPVGQGREVAQVHLGLGVPVGHQVLGVDPERLLGHLGDRPQPRRVGDLDVRQHGQAPSVRGPLTPTCMRDLRHATSVVGTRRAPAGQPSAGASRAGSPTASSAGSSPGFSAGSAVGSKVTRTRSKPLWRWAWAYAA